MPFVSQTQGAAGPAGRLPRSETGQSSPPEHNCGRTAGIDYVGGNVLGGNFWGYSNFWYDMLYLWLCLALRSVWCHEKCRTWATNDSLIREVTMVDLPTPSALYIRRRARRAKVGPHRRLRVECEHPFSCPSPLACVRKSVARAVYVVEESSALQASQWRVSPPALA